MSVTIGIDTGGTFTDACAWENGTVVARTKQPSTPGDPAAGFRAAIEALLEVGRVKAADITRILYGTTVVTNALLAGEIPPIRLIITEGFREILEAIRTPEREEPADGIAGATPRLVALENVYGLRERIDADGTIRTRVAREEVRELARSCRSDPAPVAVVLLHSYRNDVHEQAVRELFADEAPDLRVVLSSEVLPEVREYERTVATCMSAALHSVIGAHLADLETSDPIWVMKSSGGLGAASDVVRDPTSTILSGPSACVVGIAELARALGRKRVMSLDVGGTSTDVALIEDGRFAVTTDAAIAGYPLRTPVVDVLSIGSGGGSVAGLGADHRWHVGPKSAAAHPGPACYGAGGTEPTLCDAQLMLGRLPGALLGGSLPLSLERAEQALAEFGRARNLDARSTARGIVEIANHDMCGAIRRASVQRGKDPREYTLVAVGGAGPLHAAELAELLGLSVVIVPPHPGLAAAAGLAAADVREDFAHTLCNEETRLDMTALVRAFCRLEAGARDVFGQERYAGLAPLLERAIDMRYVGMSSELTIPLDDVTRVGVTKAIESFHRAFHERHGYSYRGEQRVELVHLRLSAAAHASRSWRGSELFPGAPDPTPASHRQVWFSGTAHDTAVFSRDALGGDFLLPGPCIIEEHESTTLVPPGFSVEPDRLHNLILRRQQ